jgi:hypothetical protein
VSLLLDHGHSDARFYPLGMVWDEAEIVVERMNQEDASRTVLLQLAAASIISKEGGKLLKKTLKELTDGK